MAKGSAFERELCRKLSLWFSEGQADDWLWRSAGSGSRATTRAKQGKGTRGHGGDIAPTCTEAEPLTRLFSIEAKRGYASATLHDVFDKPLKASQQQFEKWIQQASDSAEQQSSFSWWLITRRDRRLELITFPLDVKNKLRKYGAEIPPEIDCLYVVTGAFVRLNGHTPMRLVTMRLDQFLERVTPDVILQAYVDFKLKGE